MVHKALLLASAASTAALTVFGAETTADPQSEPARPLVESEAFRAELYWADYDGDGRTDAYAVQPDGTARLLRNTGTGFEDVTEAAGLALSPMPTGAAWHDVDGDGTLDLLLFSRQGPARLFRGQAGAFEDWTSSSGLGGLQGLERAGWLDADGDGRADLHVVTSEGHCILRNAGEGRFERLELPLAAGSTPAVAGATVVATAGAANARGGAPGPELARPERERPDATGGTRVDAPRSGGSSAGTTIPNPPGVEYVGGGFLNVFCPDALVDQSAPEACVQASSAPTYGMLYPLGDELFIDAGGRVGVGTTSPVEELHVKGNAGLVALEGSTHAFVSFYPQGTGAGRKGWIGYGAAGTEFMQVRNEGSGDLILVSQSDLHVIAPGGVGIGTDEPETSLHVEGGSDVAASGGGYVMAGRLDGMNIAFDDNEIMARVDGSTAPLYVNNEGGDVLLFAAGGGRLGIGTATPTKTLEVNGDAKVHTVEITGGADIVERFQAGGRTLEPGTVVAIDPQLPGALEPSGEAYDTKVAGVVSGAGGVNPGLCLGQEGVLEGDVLVAMTGRVWVKCSAENGAIEPGDLLTTAELDGHAMRASDPERWPGTVIGKAMSALDAGTGLVLVLVNLQ